MGVRTSDISNNPGSKATFCISIDFDVTRPHRRFANKQGTLLALKLFEKYKIKATWAICGKTAEEDPESYDRIIGSSIAHEIAIHTYSHLDVSTATELELERDIEKCIEVLHVDNQPVTFIFPWNRVAHLDVLQRMGFKTFRGKERQIGLPYMENGLWNIPPVHYLGSKAYGTQNYIKKLIDLCISARCNFHLWFHPWDLVKPNPLDFSRETFEPVLKYLAEKRDKGVLANLTMMELAAARESSITQKAG
ncbi:MAG: polysaccharide deacetylase family protein [Conexivisphaerales archaeon]